MSWFAELAGKAENLLNNLDEQTGAALRNHNVEKQKKNDRLQHREIPYSEPNWTQKRRTNRRSPSPHEIKSFNNVPSKKLPVKSQNRFQNKESTEFVRISPQPKTRDIAHYSLDHCPKTLVNDVRDNDFGLAPLPPTERRRSLPSELELIRKETYRMQNLEVENAMVKNELNVTNREVSELLDRLRITEDELRKTQSQLETSQSLNKNMSEENYLLISQMEQLKQKINELADVELINLKEKNQQMDAEVLLLSAKNKELEEELKKQTEILQNYTAVNTKLENEIRHTQSNANDIKNEVEKTKAECVRLEKDWEAYKLRVKSMLHSKDEKIKSLQDGLDISGETKEVLEQLEQLKNERDSLTESVSRVRKECENMKQCMEQLQSRHTNAERVVLALRDALREERAAKNKAESQCIAIGKELKSMQIETGQTIASLRTALRDKDNELSHIREASLLSVPSGDTSALNVADYDVTSDAADNEKLHYLTQLLVQKQEKIDGLMADGNMLRIQMDKLESKYKMELSSVRGSNSHSVVNLHEDHRPKSRTKHLTESTMSVLSLRLGVLLKRYPIFRMFVVIYMIVLHFWVLTVLFTSTPEDFIKKPNKI